MSLRAQIGGMLSSGGSVANPFAALFGAGDTGDVWLPIPGQSPMFTDAAATDPADTNGDSVRSFVGMVNGLDMRAIADANRPVLNTDGTSWWLVGNDTSHQMSVAYSQSAYPLLIAGVFRSGGANSESIVAVYGGTTNIYKAIITHNIAPVFRAWDRNASLLAANGPTGAPTTAYVRANFTSANVLVHADGVDGVAVTNTNAYGTSTDIVLFDGRAGTIQAPSAARCYGLMVRNRLFTDAAEEAIFRDTVLAAQGML
jgi:hypothetical protein